MNDKTWINRIVSGFLIGLGLVIPGVSGGIIAMILGLYEPIIEVMAKPLTNWRKNVSLLGPLALGIGSCLLVFSRVLEYLFKYYPQPTLYFFFGLILGSFPVVIRLANKNGFRPRYILSLTVGLGMLLLIISIPKFGGLRNIFPKNIIGAVLEGSIVAFGLVIPGLSVSFLLLAFGLYEKLISAVAHFQIGTLAPLLLGFIPSIILSSKVIHWLFRHKHGHTSYVILGILVGSLILAFPGWPNNLLDFLLGSYLFFLGLKISNYFNQRTTNI